MNGVVRVPMDVFRLRHVVAAAAGAAALWIAVARPFDLGVSQANSAALIVAVLALWATAIIPEILTSLLFFLLAMLLVVAPAEVVFSGFHSAANWTVFGGLVIGAAVQTTGLGARIANAFARRFTFGYAGVIAGMVTVGVVLAFLMPSSMGRIVLLAPIAMALAERLGFRPGSNGYLGVVLAMGFGTSSPAAGILPANVPNLVLMGGAESVYGVVLTYGPYLLLHFPTLGVLKALVIVGAIVVMFPDRPTFSDQGTTDAPASADEKRLGLFLVLALLAWMTDFAHQVSPSLDRPGGSAGLHVAGHRRAAPDHLRRQHQFRPHLPHRCHPRGRGPGGPCRTRRDHRAGTSRRRRFRAGPRRHDVCSGDPDRYGGPVPHHGAGYRGRHGASFGEHRGGFGASVATVLNMHAVGYSNYLLPYQMGPLLIVGAVCNVPNAQLTRTCLAVGLTGLLVLTPVSYLWWRFPRLSELTHSPRPEYPRFRRFGARG